ncbi:hypothetical protein NMY22_g16406 [Coprinellus aureogranulatus]|nr:hypothetical protein NMY22_g16406 [Coprinellus aureogranulatus]
MGSFGVRSDDETERQRGDYDVEHLTNFIRCDQSSPSQLQKLHIKSGSFFDGALCHLLRDLDSLKELKLEWLSLWSHDSDDFLSLTICKPPCLQQLKTIEVSNLKYPTEREIPFLRYFAEERGINLKLSLHDREAWEEDEKRYLYLVGMDSDSEWDDD